jgi:hypothetical protein
MGRTLNADFLKELKTGTYAEIVNIVRRDDNLTLQLRGTYVNVYYKSSSILKIEPSQNNPFSIDEGYACPIKPGKGNWDDYFMQAKRSIDIHKKDALEKDIQQRLVQENNFSRIANGTDYFIIDIEYTKSDFRQGRFDAVAAYWPKDKRKSGDAELALIEVKVGEDTIDDPSGIKKHIDDANDFLSSNQKTSFIDDMEEVFSQLRELDLIRFGKAGNPHRAKFSRSECQFILILADYNRNSSKLKSALAEINDDILQYKLRFATSSFMGYGLYADNMLPLDRFKELYKLTL